MKRTTTIAIALSMFVSSIESALASDVSATAGLDADRARLADAVILPVVGHPLGTDELPVLVAPEAEPYVVIGEPVEAAGGIAAAVDDRSLLIAIMTAACALLVLFGRGTAFWLQPSWLGVAALAPVKVSRRRARQPQYTDPCPARV